MVRAIAEHKDVAAVGGSIRAPGTIMSRDWRSRRGNWQTANKNNDVGGGRRARWRIFGFAELEVRHITRSGADATVRTGPLVRLQDTLSKRRPTRALSAVRRTAHRANYSMNLQLGTPAVVR